MKRTSLTLHAVFMAGYGVLLVFAPYLFYTGIEEATLAAARLLGVAIISFSIISALLMRRLHLAEPLIVGLAGLGTFHTLATAVQTINYFSHQAFVFLPIIHLVFAIVFWNAMWEVMKHKPAHDH
jgi:hypothetical protein